MEEEKEEHKEEHKHVHHEHHKAHSEHKESSKIFGLWNIFVAISVLLGIILIVNIVLTFNLNQGLKKNIAETQERLKPAKIELIVIKNSKCTDCFDISTIVSHLKNANVEITKETMIEFDSSEGKEIINKYKIEKIPTLVVKGKTGKINIQGLQKKEDVLLFLDVSPPYTNALTGKIEGRVRLYLLKEQECAKCNDLDTLIKQLKATGIKISEEKNITVNSNEGQELIKKYNIDFASSLVLSPEAGAYDIIQRAWQQIGSKEKDGFYVLRSIYPPYINLTTNELKGIVNIIYLIDKKCAECYDVMQHKAILTSPQSFAIKLEQEETYDIGDEKGKELVSKYNITQVPTIILSEGIKDYPTSSVLRQFFSIENDGFYVFRRLAVMGAYRDLITNQVVQPQPQQTAHG